MYSGLLWDDIPILALDTETTGFDSDARIVEIGLALIGEEGQIVDSFQTLVNPGIPIPEDAAEVHGIRDHDVRNAPTFEEVTPALTEWFACDAPWVAHNAPFDFRMLSYVWPMECWPRDVPTFCTLQKARERGHRGRAKLLHLAQHYGVEQQDAHRALDDARVCGQIARKMTRGVPILNYYTRLSHEWVFSP